MKLAQIQFGTLENISTPGLGSNNLAFWVNRAIIYVFPLAGMAMLIFLILGGFQIMTSAGNPKNLEEGRNKITYAIIGFVIIFMAFWIVEIVARILGLQLIINVFG